MKQKLLLSLATMIVFAVCSFVVVPSVSAATQTDCTSGVQDCLENSDIIKLLRDGIRFLSAGVGVVVTAMIIIGGMQYMRAGDNPSEVSAAKQKIWNAIFALICFGLLFAFVQWLVPGGIID